MPDNADPESSGDGHGRRVPRPDDLRNLKLGSHRRAGPVRERAEAQRPADDRTQSGPSSTSDDWIEPGQSRPSASGQEWIDPRDRSKGSADGSDESPWQRMFGSAGPNSDPALTGKPPTHWKRILAYIIDACIIAAALSVIFPAVLGQPFIDIDGIRAWIEASANQANLEQSNGLNTTETSSNTSDSNPFPLPGLNYTTALNIAVFVLYHGVLLGLTGATVGKRLFGISVLGTNGLPIGILRGVVRSLGLYATASLTVLGLAVGFLVILIHPQRRALHDFLAGSYPIERSQSFERVDQT